MRTAPLLLLFSLGCGAAQPPPGEPPDRDGDGVVDARDACRLRAEDLDGFEDDDGCPDPDNDGDRVLDVDDRCPCQPETYNGGDDEDGCPDECRVLLVDTRIQFLEEVFFAPSQAELPPDASPILDDIARVLGEHPEIRHVTVHGHASRDERSARALSEARARAVMAALVERGVAAERLAAVGHGVERPQAAPGTEEAAERNRRVDFEVDDADDPPARRSCRPLPGPRVAGCGG